MFSKINRMEDLLKKLAESLEQTETKRFTANQALKAQDIHLAEGATLNINMNNMIFSVEIVKECLEIVAEVRQFLPSAGHTTIKNALNHYENMLMVKALQDNSYRVPPTAESLGLTERQVRYWQAKNPEHRRRSLPAPTEIVDE